MGCGSSKEDTPKPTAQDTSEQPQPIRKVRTNFSDINYDEPATQRRDTAYAPSEVPRHPSTVAEERGHSVDVQAVREEAAAQIEAETAGLAPESAKPRRKSWYEKFQDKKLGRDSKFTDAELKESTGKTNEEMKEWAEGAPGVGKNQVAGKVDMGSSTGLGTHGE